MIQPFWHDQIKLFFGQTFETGNSTSDEIIQAPFWIDCTSHVQFIKRSFIIQTMTVDENSDNFGADWLSVGDIIESNFIENMIQTKNIKYNLWYMGDTLNLGSL